jgi:hypothetical protein
VSFLEEAENKKSPNSCVVVEIGLDEIPLTLGFNSQMPQVEDVELPNSCTVVEVNLDEIPLTSSVNSSMLHSSTTKVCPFHLIFNLNGIMITTCFNMRSCTIIFHRGLKEFLEKCLTQFQVYIWFIAQSHNI